MFPAGYCIILVRQLFQMRNYSFSNISNQQSYISRKSSDPSQLYRHADTKTTESLLRFDQIKKNYDTPSRLDALRQGKDLEQPRKEGREHARDSRYPLSSNLLKESFAVNRLQNNGFRFDAEVKEIVRGRQPSYKNGKENSYGPTRCDYREDEAVIVSKVRQMKESILNQQAFKNPSIPSNTTRNSLPLFAKHANYGDIRYDGKHEFQPRVENIDKINSKIKQILSCLSSNERQQHTLKQKQIIVKEDRNSSRDSARFGQKTRQGSESKRQYDSIFAKKPEITSKISDREEKQSYQVKEKDFIDEKEEISLKDNSISRPTKNEEQLVKTPIYPSKDEAHRAASRSRSQIDSNQKSNTNQNVLKSGKKVSEQISRIQKKIEQFQQEKRRLNIQFTPFTLKNKSTANLNTSYSAKPEKLSEDHKDSSKNVGNTRSESQNHDPSRFNASQRSSSNDLKFKSYLNRAADYSLKYGNFANKDRQTSKSIIYESSKSKIQPKEDFELRIQQIQVKKIQPQDASIENNEKNAIFEPEQSVVTIDGETLKRRTDEGIEERRKRMSKDTIISTETLKCIVSRFCQQVKLDQNLRNLKIWLQTYLDSDKFSKISKALEAKGMQISPEQCRSLFAVKESQNNPFFSVQSFSGSYNALAQTYCASQENWKSNIQHKFERTALTAEGFNTQKIDLQRKGFIELEDLVRFLNIESGTFFRNRDLFLIFRRLTTGDRVDFSSILDEVCV